MDALTKIAEIIKKNHDIGIYAHVNADGDALGSCCALALVLKAMGKKPVVYLEEPVEERLLFLAYPEIELHVGIPEGQKAHTLSIALDCGTEERLKNRTDFFRASPQKILIDHHKTGIPFGDLYIVDEDWAATCEGIYELIGILGGEINREAAICLYTGLLTDTGGFAYSNTTYITHRIASELQYIFGDASWISQKAMDQVTKESLKLSAIAYQKIEYYMNGRIAWLDITKNDYIESGATPDDTQVFPGILRSIQGVDVSVMTRPGETGFKVSLRSNACCDVSAVSAKYNGGGHMRAAGFSTDIELGQLKEQLVNALTDAII